MGEEYITSLHNNSSLHVTISDQAAKAYDQKAEYRVFSLFFTPAFKDRLRKWTSDVLVEAWHEKITASEFNAYLGLEIAMSICPMSEIAAFWFQQIRGALALHPPQPPSFDKERDPLWRCRGIMEHFQLQFAEFAVPIGGTPYTSLFPTLRTPLYNTLRAQDVDIEPDTATAMWIAMAGHQTQTLRSPTGHRLVVSDNFYTRHTLLKFTDVAAAVARVGVGERGSWELVAAVDPEPGWEEKKKAHQKTQRRIAKAYRTEYKPAILQAQRAGYIVDMDRKVVIFYANDLKATPSALTMASTSQEAVFCCPGTYPIQRWTDDRMLHRKISMAPTVIAAYNLCMNAVDRVDQLRSTNPIRRREKRLGMAMITWLMHLAIVNAQTLINAVQPDAAKGVSLREFKRRIADVLTSSEKQNKRRREMQQKKRATEILEEIVGMDTSLHMRP
ncbi:hypothetical protein ON010_g14673 [Phytophthora cinnamomi]|nr:hypothetical protein ON010_g14673 [Phytophthora cinnamomi]